VGEQADLIVDAWFDQLWDEGLETEDDFAVLEPVDNPRVTRALKAKAHKAFDRIWQSGRMGRGQAYLWLARRLNVRPEQAHMAAMDRHDILERVIEVSDRFMGTPLAAADFPDDD